MHYSTRLGKKISKGGILGPNKLNSKQNIDFLEKSFGTATRIKSVYMAPASPTSKLLTKPTLSWLQPSKSSSQQISWWMRNCNVCSKYCVQLLIIMFLKCKSLSFTEIAMIHLITVWINVKIAVVLNVPGSSSLILDLVV